MEFDFRSAFMVLGVVGTGVSAFTAIGAFCVDYRKTAIAASVATCVFAFLFGGTLRDALDKPKQKPLTKDTEVEE